MKCTKNYNARAQLLFCSLNLLSGDAPVAVAVVFCVRSPLLAGERFTEQQFTEFNINDVNAT